MPMDWFAKLRKLRVNGKSRPNNTASTSSKHAPVLKDEIPSHKLNLFPNDLPERKAPELNALKRTFSHSSISSIFSKKGSSSRASSRP